MSACVVEEGRDEGGGGVVDARENEVQERPRRDVLLSARGRRACSEQGPQSNYNMRKCISIKKKSTNKKREYLGKLGYN